MSINYNARHAHAQYGRCLFGSKPLKTINARQVGCKQGMNVNKLQSSKMEERKAEEEEEVGHCDCRSRRMDFWGESERTSNMEYLCDKDEEKAGHRSTLRFCVSRGNWKTQAFTGKLLWITWCFRTIAAFSINSGRLDASVFTSRLPVIKCRSRTCEQLAFCRTHCSRRRRHTQVDFTSPRKSRYPN